MTSLSSVSSQKRASLDLEETDIICTARSKDDDTVLTQAMLAREAVLWSSAQTAEGGIGAFHNT